MEIQENPFSPLPLPSRPVPVQESRIYRVYKSSKEFVRVKAETASTAIKLAKIPAPYKIAREPKPTEIFLLDETMLEPPALIEQPGSNGHAASAPPPPPAAAALPEPELETVPHDGEGLSPEEVEALIASKNS